MPQSKDLKRLVRARMRKTGESYTTARAQLVKKRTSSSAATPTAVPARPAADFATLAGLSDAAVLAATGRTWKNWAAILDAIGATAIPHREVASHLHTEHALSGWWAQTVTVGYERIRGLRAIGQRRSGSWEMSKSKTVPVPISKVYAAFASEPARERWLTGARVEVRKSTPERSMRITWADGTSVGVWFTAKGHDKSQVVVQHAALASAADSAKMKAYWADRLEALAALLAPGAGSGPAPRRRGPRTRS